MSQVPAIAIVAVGPTLLKTPSRLWKEFFMRFSFGDLIRSGYKKSNLRRCS